MKRPSLYVRIALEHRKPRSGLNLRDVMGGRLPVWDSGFKHFGDNEGLGGPLVALIRGAVLSGYYRVARSLALEPYA